ncbi:MAG: hypothetical protein AVDCRST_MAG13-118, partial [uncultured Solirubrobacteraceae bacterium]
GALPRPAPRRRRGAARPGIPDLDPDPRPARHRGVRHERLHGRRGRGGRGGGPHGGLRARGALPRPRRARGVHAGRRGGRRPRGHHRLPARARRAPPRDRAGARDARPGHRRLARPPVRAVLLGVVVPGLRAAGPRPPRRGAGRHGGGHRRAAPGREHGLPPRLPGGAGRRPRQRLRPPRAGRGARRGRGPPAGARRAGLRRPARRPALGHRRHADL